MDDLIFRLRKRAEIRRQISTRRSVERGEADKIADLLDESANRIEKNESEIKELKEYKFMYESCNK